MRTFIYLDTGSCIETLPSDEKLPPKVDAQAAVYRTTIKGGVAVFRISGGWELVPVDRIAHIIIRDDDKVVEQ